MKHRRQDDWSRALSPAAVRARLGLSASALDEMISSGRFPEPSTIKPSIEQRGGVGWPREVVERWIAERSNDPRREGLHGMAEPPKSALRMVKLADLRERQPGVWHERETDNADILAHYTARLEDGDKPPPIEVMEEHDGSLVILNGNHRVLSARRIDPDDTIEARVFPLPAGQDKDAYHRWLGAALPPAEWLDYFHDPSLIPPEYPALSDTDH